MWMSCWHVWRLAVCKLRLGKLCAQIGITQIDITQTDAKGDEGTLLAMSARNEEKDTLIASGSFRGHSKIKIQSVASSAGGTAMMAIVAQPHRGHLNGNVNDEFDMEEYYARATVAGIRAQSLTVIVSPIDMQGMIGMMQVLAGRAHPIHEIQRRHYVALATIGRAAGSTIQGRSPIPADFSCWHVGRTDPPSISNWIQSEESC